MGSTAYKAAGQGIVHIITQGMRIGSGVGNYICILLNINCFRSVFSHDRFLQIFGMLHVGAIDSSCKRDKMQPLHGLLCPVFESAYTPNQNVAINKSMISFRGRVSFRQYIKGKPTPWEIKAYVLSVSLGTCTG